MRVPSGGNCAFFISCQHTGHALPVATPQLVVGDRTEQQADAEFAGCLSVSPGCFAADGSFTVDRAAAKEVELSGV